MRTRSSNQKSNTLYINNRFRDEIIAILLFAVAPIIGSFLPTFFISWWYIFSFFIIAILFKINLSILNKKLFILLILFSLGLFLVCASQGELIIGPIFFLGFWSLFVNKKITFNPLISIYLIFIIFLTFLKEDVSTSRYYFLYDSNFSSLFLIILQLILIKNNHFKTFLISLIFLFLLQSRMLILSDFILLFVFLLKKFEIFKRLVNKFINLKIIFLISILGTIFSAVILVTLVHTWGGYRFGLIQRITGGLTDKSNAERVMANAATYKLILKEPSIFVTGYDFEKYNKLMAGKGIHIAHNYVLSAFMNYGIGGVFLLFMLYNIIDRKYDFQNKIAISIWLFCATILNVAIVASYFGTMFLFVTLISNDKDIVAKNKTFIL